MTRFLENPRTWKIIWACAAAALILTIADRVVPNPPAKSTQESSQHAEVSSIPLPVREEIMPPFEPNQPQPLVQFPVTVAAAVHPYQAKQPNPCSLQANGQWRLNHATGYSPSFARKLSCEMWAKHPSGASA